MQFQHAGFLPTSKGPQTTIAIMQQNATSAHAESNGARAAPKPEETIRRMADRFDERRTLPKQRPTADLESAHVTPPEEEDDDVEDRPSQTGPDSPVLTEKVWNRLRHDGRLVRDEVTADLPPMLRPLAWQQFKELPMARRACQLIMLLEPQKAVGLYRRKRRGTAAADLFDDISQVAQRDRAKEIYAELCDRHAERLASCSWLRPVLAGRARWLATNPNTRDSAWGTRMRRIKAGKHTQRRYQDDGWHPLASVRKAWGLAGERPQSARVPRPCPKL
jgi:hypothetical protein